MHVEMDMKIISRAGGRGSVRAAAYRSGTSVVAKAAYRSGDSLEDDKYDVTHDYTKKENILYTGILTPKDAPEWTHDREQLWNAVEAKEDTSTRPAQAQLAREAVLILPRGLSSNQHQELVTRYAQESFVNRGMIADIAIHEPESSDGQSNPHAHVMLTMRRVDSGGFGNKERGWNSKAMLKTFRKEYEQQVNKTLEDSGSDYRADLRSNKDKGLDREAQPKLGANVIAMEKAGERTKRGDEWRRVQRRNAQLAYYESMRNQPGARDGDWMHSNSWVDVQKTTAGHEASKDLRERKAEIETRVIADREERKNSRANEQAARRLKQQHVAMQRAARLQRQQEQQRRMQQQQRKAQEKIAQQERNRGKSR